MQVDSRNVTWVRCTRTACALSTAGGTKVSYILGGGEVEFPRELHQDGSVLLT
jgi:hypothetical protein